MGCINHMADVVLAIRVGYCAYIHWFPPDVIFKVCDFLWCVSVKLIVVTEDPERETEWQALIPMLE